MFKGKDDFYKEPCSKNCKIKDYWFEEYPEIGKQLNLSSVLICLGCIYFESGNHFVPRIDRGYDKN